MAVSDFPETVLRTRPICCISFRSFRMRFKDRHDAKTVIVYTLGQLILVNPYAEFLFFRI
jgi:hypothetical protein